LTKIEQRASSAGEAGDECFVDVFLDQIEQIQDEKQKRNWNAEELPKAHKYFQ
jgi:hypothetical protein